MAQAPVQHSRRAARRASIEAKHRTLKHLEAEGREIYEKFLGWRSAKLVPLEKPLFIGYARTHVVRSDIARSPDAANAALVLKYLGRTIYSRNKDFTRKNRKTKQTEAIPHDLNSISEGEWKRLKLDEIFPERVLRMFRPKLERHKPTPHSPTQATTYVKYFIFDKPWWFDTKISRHYATHVRAVDGEAESIYDRIENKLRTENWYTTEYGHGGRPYHDIKEHRFWQDPFKPDNWHVYTDEL